MADPSIQSTPLHMLPLQGDLPYDDTNDEEQDHQREQPGAEALLPPCRGQCRNGAVALCRLPHPKSIFFLREQMYISDNPHPRSRVSCTA